MTDQLESLRAQCEALRAEHDKAHALLAKALRDGFAARDAAESAYAFYVAARDACNDEVHPRWRERMEGNEARLVLQWSRLRDAALAYESLGDAGRIDAIDNAWVGVDPTKLSAVVALDARRIRAEQERDEARELAAQALREGLAACSHARSSAERMRIERDRMGGALDAERAITTDLARRLRDEDPESGPEFSAGRVRAMGEELQALRRRVESLTSQNLSLEQTLRERNYALTSLGYVWSQTGGWGSRSDQPPPASLTAASILRAVWKMRDLVNWFYNHTKHSREAKALVLEVAPNAASLARAVELEGRVMDVQEERDEALALADYAMTEGLAACDALRAERDEARGLCAQALADGRSVCYAHQADAHVERQLRIDALREYDGVQARMHVALAELYALRREHARHVGLPHVVALSASQARYRAALAEVVKVLDAHFGSVRNVAFDEARGLLAQREDSR